MPKKLDNKVIQDRFDRVKELISLGYKKYNAYKKLNISSGWVSVNFTSEQKATIDQMYYSFSTGNGARKAIRQ